MLNRKGQSTLEYALIIAVIVAGLLLMQHYVRRGYAGKLKSASDDVGQQYDPRTNLGTITSTQSRTTQETVQNRTSTKMDTAPRTQTTTATETVGAWGETEDLFSR